MNLNHGLILVIWRIRRESIVIKDRVIVAFNKFCMTSAAKKRKTMKKLQLFACLLTTTCFITTGPVWAVTEETTTIESHVVVVPSETTQTTTYTIIGPQNTRYSVLASPSEERRIETIIKTNPDAVIRFNGEVEDVDGEKKFRVKQWEETTSKEITVDSSGRTVTEQTTTHHRD